MQSPVTVMTDQNFDEKSVAKSGNSIKLQKEWTRIGVKMNFVLKYNNDA